MTRRGQRRLLCLLLITGGIVAILLAGPLLLDQERYRGILIGRISQLLNRKVTASSLRIYLLPSPEVTIRGVVIADRAPWSEPFVDAEQLHVAVELFPLLKGDIQVGNIRIDRPRIRLARGPDGWNLEDLIRPAARAASAEPHRADGARAAKGQPPVLPALAAGTLAIRHGTLVLDHPLYPRGPATLELKEIDLDIPAPLTSAPFRVRASGQLPGKSSGSFDIVGRVQRADGDRMPAEVEFHARGVEVAHLASFIGVPRASAGAAFTGTIDLTGKAVGEWPRLDLETYVDLQRLGVALATDTGKTPKEKASLRMKGRWDGNTLDLSDMNLLWKGQTVSGRLHLATRQSPRLQVWLHTPDLAIEPLIAFATGTSGTTDPANPPHPTPNPLPPSAPRAPAPLHAQQKTGERDGLQIEAHLRSNTLRWGKLVLTAAESDLDYCCRLLTIRRLRGGLYGGTLSGGGTIDWRDSAPRTTVATHLDGVQTEPLLSAIQEPRWTLHGVMTLDSKIEIAGQLGSGALARTSGQTDVAVTNGRVTGYTPLERLSKTADPVLKGLGLPPLTLNEFDRLSAHFTLDSGILRTRDLTLLRNGGRFYASGSFNLLSQTMDFDVTAKVGKATLEAKVAGPSSDPKVTPQAGSIEGRIKTEVGKVLEKGGSKELGKMLEQLFRR